MATISLDPVAIDQLSGERKAFLDAIYRLRRYGIRRHVDLPQIIVVGDQSSGKSSVLEAISRVRFPVKDGSCTRFATELVLRTDPQTKLQVRVQRASASTDVPYTFSETRFEKDDLSRIIEEAKTYLLRDGAAISEDVLRIEICSPDVPHLTLVDLPGIYHSELENQSAADRKIVDSLVESYMAKKNSIILVIVSSSNQFILPKVLPKLMSIDKNQDRTLGIITKPDILIHGSLYEENYMKLARNLVQPYRLPLGWHILRNRGETEAALSFEDRDLNEQAFFDSSIWSAIPANSRGAGALRKKLASILLDHIRNNLDTLMKDIDDNLTSRQQTLKQLGEPRSSPRQIRVHLDKIASRFQRLSLHAIEGNYSDEFFGDLYADGSAVTVDDNRIKKLRALVRDLNRTFSYVLLAKGSRRIIGPDSRDGGNHSSHEIDLPPFLQMLKSHYPFHDPEKVTRDTVRAELEPLLSANQGNEFPGTTNDLLAVKLFRDQSRPWEAIARFHIDLLLRIVKSFTEKLVAHITGPDQKTCSAILLHIVDPFFEERTRYLEDKLQELLYNFRSGFAQPLETEFRAIMEQRRQKYFAADTLQKLLANRPDLFTDKGKIELANLPTSSRKSELGIDSLIDKSETYYELSLRTFMDNVIILAVENCLMKDIPMILTTNRVSQMEDDELYRLAAESADMQAERSMLQGECEALKKGLDLCKTYRARNSTVSRIFPHQPQVSSPQSAGLPVTEHLLQQTPPLLIRVGQAPTLFGESLPTPSRTPDSFIVDNQSNAGTAASPSGSSTVTKRPLSAFTMYNDVPIKAPTSATPTTTNPKSTFTPSIFSSGEHTSFSTSTASGRLIPETGFSNTIFGNGAGNGTSKYPSDSPSLFAEPAPRGTPLSTGPFLIHNSKVQQRKV